MASRQRDKKKKKEKTWDSLKPPTVEPLPATEIKQKDGRHVEQSPPAVGHHGSDDEKDLNAEE